jgi:hypothetical protein
MLIKSFNDSYHEFFRSGNPLFKNYSKPDYAKELLRHQDLRFEYFRKEILARPPDDRSKWSEFTTRLSEYIDEEHVNGSNNNTSTGFVQIQTADMKQP